MNTTNLEYLQENLKYLGFENKLNDDLQKNVSRELPAFQLELEIPHFNKTMDFTFHFKKSDQSDIYFLNKYDAVLKLENGEADRNQTFYITKGAGITAKEAFNLLEGRAVHKELVNKEDEKYQAWLQLDFKEKDQNDNYKVRQFHQSYGYDLEKTLNRFPIKELQDAEQKEALLKSLHKGNLQQVKFIQDGVESKRFIEANPQFKNINIYSENMKLIHVQAMSKENKEEKQSPDNKNEIANDVSDSLKKEITIAKEDKALAIKRPKKPKLSL